MAWIPYRVLRFKRFEMSIFLWSPKIKEVGPITLLDSAPTLIINTRARLEKPLIRVTACTETHLEEFFIYTYIHIFKTFQNYIAE
jgi:hypothetical protein